MNKTDIMVLANRYFLAVKGSDMPNLIRRIQTAQGNSPCFATGKNDCEEFNCQWRQSCLQEGASDLEAGTETTNHG